MRPDGGDAEVVLARVGRAGIDVDALAADLQREGAESFVVAGKTCSSCIESKAAASPPGAGTGPAVTLVVGTRSLTQLSRPGSAGGPLPGDVRDLHLRRPLRAGARRASG